MKKCTSCNELFSDKLYNCPECGQLLERCVRSPEEEMRIMRQNKLRRENPKAYYNSGLSKKPIGILLIIISIILDLVSMLLVSTDDFIPVITVSSFIFVAGFFILLFSRGENISKYKSISKTTNNSVSNADELKKFKDLLDSGAITQAEFEEKKKQLLNL